VITAVSIGSYSVAIIGSYFFQSRITYVTIFIFVCLGVGFFTAGIVMILSIR